MRPWILVGEFEPARLETWSRAAAEEGLEAFGARDGDEVLAQLEKRGAPALVVCGLSLPRADGFEVLRKLRARQGSVPAIATSPFRRLEAAARERQAELGLQDVIGGPIDAEIAGAAIRRILAGAPSPGVPDDASRRYLREQRQETARLSRIESQGIDRELPHDPTLQRIVEEGARALGAPAILLSIVLQDRTRFLAHCGLGRMLAAEPAAEVEWPFCRLVVEAGQELVVPDAGAHPAFLHNPLVRDGHVRGYAGTPVAAPGGEIIGALAVASSDRLMLRAAQIDALSELARRVAGEIEIRSANRRAGEDADTFGSALGAEDGPTTLMATLATARAALDCLDSGVILMDAQRRVVYANPAACRMFDSTPSRLLGMTREQLVGQGCVLAANPEEFLRRVRVAPSGPYVGRADLAFARPSRRILRWVCRPVLLPSGLGQLGLLTDVTAERVLDEERRRFALVDPLTRLPNRRSGLATLTREIGRATRGGERLCVALVGLAGLATVNRDLGSGAGDELLRRAAAEVTRASRAGDIVVRWSGAEFLAVLPGCTADEGRAVAERASRNLDFPGTGAMPGPGLAAGVVEWRPGETAEALLFRAEEQMRGARSCGGAPG